MFDLNHYVPSEKVLQFKHYIYNKISNLEFKEIFYDQINEIEEFNKYLLEVTVVKMKNSESGETKEFFEIIRVAENETRNV